MANRKPLRPQIDPFRTDGDAPAAMAPHAEELFEEARRREDKRQFARPLQIAMIHPDPAQPRRAIPHVVRAGWQGQPERLPALFSVWRDLAEAERGAPLDVVGRVLAEGDHAETDAASSGPLEASLLALADLAGNIRRHGLLNPITVAKTEGGYQIETGERRWLAHHLLHWVTQDADWLIIAGRVVEQTSVWRQAGENSARANLNAISKARQFALLLMDLYRAEMASTDSVPFKSFDDVVRPGQCDRAYYAQVADSQRYRVPKGKGELLLNAMGLKGRATFSRYRALLQLPNEVWQFGDDYNWSDDRLYLLATMEPGEAIRRARHMKRRDDLQRREPTVLSQNKMADTGTPDRLGTRAPLETRDFKRRTIRVARMVDRLERLNAAKRREGLEEIGAIRAWLDDAERALSDSK